jgi:hypothetical protein
MGVGSWKLGVGALEKWEGGGKNYEGRLIKIRNNASIFFLSS